MKMDLSICIVSFKARDLLQESLRSIYATIGKLSFEIIVVDNCSEDGTVEMLKSEFPTVQLIVNDENTGYTRPNNQAMRVSKGRYLVIINPDTLVKPGAFETLAAFLDSHPEAGIVGPKVLNRDGTLQKQCRRSEARPWDAFCYFSGLSRLYPHDKRFSGYLMTYLDEDLTHEAQAVSGSCMMIRREVIEQIGFLDEDFSPIRKTLIFAAVPASQGGRSTITRRRRSFTSQERAALVCNLSVRSMSGIVLIIFTIASTLQKIISFFSIGSIMRACWRSLGLRWL